MRFAVAVIFYNPNDNAFEYIARYADVFERVLVVDNSEEYLINGDRLKKHQNVTYHSMVGNMGMSKALEFSFHWAIENGFDYLLTMDQDSDYPLESINGMISYIEDKHEDDVAIYASNFSKIYIDKKTGEKRLGRPVMPLDQVKEVGECITSGSYVLVRAIKEILPLEDYFIAGVDYMIARKFINCGYRLVKVGLSYFAQQVGDTVYDSAFNRFFKIVHHTPVRYYYTFRNISYYKKEYYNTLGNKLFTAVAELRLVFNIIVAEENKIDRLRACRQGKKDYRAGIKGKVPNESIVWENKAR